MSKPPFEAIIFDHDGTLVDTETSDFRAWQMLYAEFGATISVERWAAVTVGHMNGYEPLLVELIQQNGNGSLTTSTLQQRLEALWSVTLEDVALMPGVERLLTQLQSAGYPLAVATASDRAWVNRWLARFKLSSFFQTVATRDDITHNKPAPDVYLFAAAQLGVAPERCLVFEDSRAGLQAAKTAGMMVVAVPSQVTQSLDFSQADGVVASLEQVTPAWIEAFAARS